MTTATYAAGGLDCANLCRGSCQKRPNGALAKSKRRVLDRPLNRRFIRFKVGKLRRTRPRLITRHIANRNQWSGFFLAKIQVKHRLGITDRGSKTQPWKRAVSAKRMWKKGFIRILHAEKIRSWS